MRKVVIETPAAPKAIGPYSQAIKANGFLFISGQIPINPETGQMTAVDVVAQTRQSMDNLGAILNAEGLGFGDVVKTTIFLTNISDFAQVNDIYSEYFESAPPARSTVQVAALPKGAKVEIEAIALSR
ncbi:MAG: RidA family protein [Armatimonadetes bacterium]|jgi:2-iminobutanoate/2-iminopropanoate deaminase|nr:RidA family protein [Armatimonadota bacterium]